MKNIVFTCSYLLLLAAELLRNESIPCQHAASNDKEAIIAELLCVENHNKTLVLQRNSYRGLLNRVRGQDGSDCLATRCINTGELSIEVTYTPANQIIDVRLGGGQIDYVRKSERATPLLSFNGIIGNVPRGVATYSCQDNPLSYLQLSNPKAEEITVTAIKLKLHYTDDSYKVVFEDTQERKLGNGGSIIFSQLDIIKNQAFRTAAEGSCQDT